MPPFLIFRLVTDVSDVRDVALLVDLTGLAG